MASFLVSSALATRLSSFFISSPFSGALHCVRPTVHIQHRPSVVQNKLVLDAFPKTINGKRRTERRANTLQKSNSKPPRLLQISNSPNKRLFLFFNSVVCLTELRINICGHKLVSSNKHRNTTVCEQIFRTLDVERSSISMSHKQTNAVCPVMNGLSLVKHIFRCMCRSPSGCRRSWNSTHCYPSYL